MLNETILEKLVERLTNRIERVNSYTLRLIGEQINRIGSMTPTNANRLINVLKYGGDIDNIAYMLSEITELNIKDIYSMFEEIAKTNYQFAKEFYDYKGINYIPYEQNIVLQDQVRALARTTANTYLNLSRTTGFVKTDEFGKKMFSDIATTYQNTIDEAILSLSQGKNSYIDNMSNTIKELGSSGIKTINYESGYTRRLDSSVRMNIMDGIRDLHNSVQEYIGKEVGTDGIEISVHENPAHDHEHIQGMQYTNEEFEKLNNGLERPISTMNCYHYVYSVIIGISEPRYSKDELEAIKKRNEEGFEFEGKKYSMYEGQQMQRKLETEIRRTKDVQIIAKASGDVELVDASQKKAADLTRKYKELSEASKLPTKMDRLKVDSYKKTKVDMSEYYNSKVNGIEINEIKINGVSNHFIKDRRLRRNLNIEMVENALKNPLKIGTIKVDEKGRPSFAVIGEQATLTINPKNGVISTGWQTGRKTAEKYKR